MKLHVCLCGTHHDLFVVYTVAFLWNHLGLSFVGKMPKTALRFQGITPINSDPSRSTFRKATRIDNQHIVVCSYGTVGPVNIQTCADFWAKQIHQTWARIPNKYLKHSNS
jgi:hypothetical protein